ncbi:hypothetical protein MRX96_029467 [Rhipicephalus microplus]
MFGPVGSGSFGSPRSERYHSDMVFDPFRWNLPAVGSPGETANNGAGGGMPVNNNSFGLGTALVPSQGAMCKSPPLPSVAEECSDAVKQEFERFSGAVIEITKKDTFASCTCNHIVSITGTPNAVSTAQYLIEQQIAEEQAKRSQKNALGVLH